MENTGVCCNVCECAHHCGSDQCDLTKIEVTNETTSQNAVAVPHFCKSYTQK